MIEVLAVIGISLFAYDVIRIIALAAILLKR